MAVGGGVSAWARAMSISSSLGQTICSIIEQSGLAGDCMLCGAASEAALCPPCIADLPQQTPADETLAVAMPAAGEPSRADCAAAPHVVAHALWRYADPADRVVLGFKYGGHAGVARLWAQQVAAHLPRVDAVVPMPMHPLRLAERGENPAEVMARELCRKLPARPRLLRAIKTRPTARQQGLDRAGRLANVAGAYRFETGLDGQRVLLVDDVLTTGASLLELAKAARAAGAASVAAAAMARASH